MTYTRAVPNTAEISGSGDVNGSALPDLDSQPDSNNKETGVDDDGINGGGPLTGEDEDNHCQKLMLIYNTSCKVVINAESCPGISNGRN